MITDDAMEVHGLSLTGPDHAYSQLSRCLPGPGTAAPAVGQIISKTHS